MKDFIKESEQDKQMKDWALSCCPSVSELVSSALYALPHRKKYNLCLPKFTSTKATLFERTRSGANRVFNKIGLTYTLSILEFTSQETPVKFLNRSSSEHLCMTTQAEALVQNQKSRMSLGSFCLTTPTNQFHTIDFTKVGAQRKSSRAQNYLLSKLRSLWIISFSPNLQSY